MPFKKIAIISVFALFVLCFAGCSKHYVMTQDIEESISNTSACSIEEFTDDLPADFPEEKKPTIEEIDKLKDFLVEELKKVEIFDYVGLDYSMARYKLTGSILDYSKGSGAIRFLFGMGLGSAKLTMGLSLIDKETDQVVFSGNFSRTISGGFESGDDKYKYIARDFAKELSKQLKKLKEKESKEQESS